MCEHMSLEEKAALIREVRAIAQQSGVAITTIQPPRKVTWQDVPILALDYGQPAKSFVVIKTRRCKDG